MTKPFVDTGFLLTLLLKTSSSEKAWETTRRLDSPLWVAGLQIFSIENRFEREVEADESNPLQRAAAAHVLQDLRWYLEQQVFLPVRLDYDIAIDLARQWQKQDHSSLPALLLLWPALAATIGATVFLSFDPRTRQLARSAGLKLLPEKL
jgi:hypothetical protein